MKMSVDTYVSCALFQWFFIIPEAGIRVRLSHLSQGLSISPVLRFRAPRGKPGALQHILGVSWPPTRKDIPEPSHGRVLREKFRSVYVVKGI